jgi:endonuclease/exonuclease/phosphatase family metal-dependent hydrolase
MECSKPGTVAVMTWNIGNGLVRPERLGSALAGLDIDLIGLQEVSAEQEATILRETEATHPYRIVRGGGFHGRGLLSRFPIGSHDWLEAAPGRPDLLARVAIGGLELTVLVGHPLPPRAGSRGVTFDSGSRAQIRGFGEVLLERAPGILLADLNMTPRNPLHAALRETGLIDAHLAAGTGAGRTFPRRPGRTRRFAHPFTWVPLPAVARIDYIWHTAEIGTERVWLGEALGSDHHPVLARLRVPVDDSGNDREESG